MSGAPIFDIATAVAGIRAPDTKITKEAMDFAKGTSSPMLFNHVMRSYYLGRRIDGARVMMTKWCS